jgi:hypothetical protein
VHVAASGRIIPLQCRLCTAGYRPTDPEFEWHGVLPERLRSPVLAAAILAHWGGRLPNQAVSALTAGVVPLAGLSETAKTISQSLQKIQDRLILKVGSLERSYGVRMREVALDASERERARKKVEATEAHARDTENEVKWTAAEQAQKEAEAQACRGALDYALSHLGECRRFPWTQAPYRLVDTLELRNMRTEWCDAGELRGDVEPDENRDMTPCLPLPRTRGG